MSDIKKFNVLWEKEAPEGEWGDYVKTVDHEAEVSRVYDDAHCKVEALYSAEIARLRDEVEKYRKDAERYRWLRDAPWFDNYEIRSVISYQQNAVWDETIDAAMGASA